jgi:hypothetical protein
VIQNIDRILKGIFRDSQDRQIEQATQAIGNLFNNQPIRREIPFLNIKKNINEWVNLDDILFVQKPKPKSKYLAYTLTGIFEQITKLNSTIDPELFPDSLFVLADTKTIVRKDKVRKYDSVRCRLYFVDHIDESSLSVEVYKKSIVEFERFLGKQHDIRTDANLYNMKVKRTLFN